MKSLWFCSERTSIQVIPSLSETTQFQECIWLHQPSLGHCLYTYNLVTSLKASLEGFFWLQSSCSGQMFPLSSLYQLVNNEILTSLIFLAVSIIKSSNSYFPESLETLKMCQTVGGGLNLTSASTRYGCRQTRRQSESTFVTGNILIWGSSCAWWFSLSSLLETSLENDKKHHRRKMWC